MPGPTRVSLARSTWGFKDFSGHARQERNYTFSGITKDSGGTPVGSAEVRLFNASTATWVQEQQAVSDAVTGAYSFVCDKTQTYLVAGYKAGGPDIMGITIKGVPV